jgi:hypothetical protein
MRHDWTQWLSAAMPSSVESWLTDHSATVYYQDWEWYSQERASAGQPTVFETVRQAASEVFDEATSIIEGVDFSGLSDLQLVRQRWHNSDRVLAASNLVADRVSAFNMWQVPGFLNDVDASRSIILERFERAVSPATKVVVAHSLGSVVAYEAINEMGLELDCFITLGSPLGVGGYVIDRLHTPPRVPATVRQWININHPNEPVAIVPELAGLFAPEDGASPIIDVSLGTRQSMPWHAVEEYLQRDEVRRIFWESGASQGLQESVG